MDQQKINFKAEKKNFQKDSIIITQGSNLREINFLHSGNIEVKRYGQDITGLNQSDIIKKGRRTGVIEAPSIFGVQNLIDSHPHNSSYIALTDCQITKYIIPSNDFLAFFQLNPPISLNILLTMQEEARKKISSIKKFYDFFSLIDKFSDNLGLLYSFVSNSKKEKLYRKFVGNGGSFPNYIDSNFISSNFSKFFDKTYDSAGFESVKKNFNIDDLDFYKNLMKIKPASFISIITSEIKVFLYIFNKLSKLINSLNIETEKIGSEIERKLDEFFLDRNSSFNQIYSISDKIKNASNVDKNIAKNIVNFCRNLNQINKQLGGREYVEVFSKYDVLSSVSKEESNDKPQTGKSIFNPLKTDATGRMQKHFKDSTKRILSYSTLPEDVKLRILKNLKHINRY